MKKGRWEKTTSKDQRHSANLEDRREPVELLTIGGCRGRIVARIMATTKKKTYCRRVGRRVKKPKKNPGPFPPTNVWKSAWKLLSPGSARFLGR